MDDNFESEFYGYEPQRPQTEKQDIPQAVQPALDIEPLEPQKPTADSEPPQPFVQQDAPQQPFTPQQPFAQQQPFTPQQPFAQQQAPQQPFAQQQPFTQQQQPQQTQPYYRSDISQPYYRPEERRPANPSNRALVVVIIVLGALLTASLVALVAFSMFTAQNSRTAGDEDGIIEQLPDITMPGGGGIFDEPTEPPATEAPAEHKESDFSDQANKKYEGLKLEDKPLDAGASYYNAEYAFKTAADSVVAVLCFTDKTDDNAAAASQGSGIIISSDGLVVTNAHLLNNSKTAYAIKVVTSDNKEYKAGVIGVDARTDLAVLKLVDAKGLKAATFGNSEQIEQGEDLIIIGNPGGIEYKNSMTKGIVSAVNRDASKKNIVKYIQTDAAINPGNSGGPAVNNYGQVIGVASAKIAAERYEGMGFCIPSAQVKTITDSLIRNGYVEGRVKIGISGVAVTATEAQLYNVPKGIIVSEINKGGPCDGTDLQQEDIILALDGKMITSFSDIYQALEDYKPGDKAKLKFYRPSDKKEYEIEITLQADQ